MVNDERKNQLARDHRDPHAHHTDPGNEDQHDRDKKSTQNPSQKKMGRVFSKIACGGEPFPEDKEQHQEGHRPPQKGDKRCLEGVGEDLAQSGVNRSLDGEEGTGEEGHKNIWENFHKYLKNKKRIYLDLKIYKAIGIKYLDVKIFIKKFLTMKREKDHVDEILEEWTVGHPELDFSSTGLIGRIHRLSSIHLMELHREVFQKHDLNRAEFDVLATLYRAPPPGKKSPRELLATLLITSGSMTNRMDRLVAKGWIERSEDPEDRRGVLISLTEEGTSKVREAIQDHLKSQEAVLSALTAKERTQLEGILKKLLLPMEKGGWK